MTTDSYMMCTDLLMATDSYMICTDLLMATDSYMSSLVQVPLAVAGLT